MPLAGIDETHDSGRRSWVESANGHPDFPIQNLPFGLFTREGGTAAPCIAVGDSILDLAGLTMAGLLAHEAEGAARAGMTGPRLNGLLATGAQALRALRGRACALLTEGAPERARVEPHLHPAERCTLHLPCEVGDYTDFYAGIHHATNVGRLFRPEAPLLPNYKHVPIGYHGRASSVRVSGVSVRRPNGQRKRPDEEWPSFGPCRNLDFELELAIWVGTGNAPGTSVPIGEAASHIAGYGLLNDWSARDMQAWEYQPLGPFLAKSFATTVSPWLVTPEALAPFRIAQPARSSGDPRPLPYLLDTTDQVEGALEIELEVLLETAVMRATGQPPHRISRSAARHLYWTPAQLLAHHASNGCDLRPGDLLGTGTISAPDEDGLGSLLEMTRGGRDPVTLPNGETRRFLEDGDEVHLASRARRDGFATIGFGPCRAVVLPAPGTGEEAAS